MITTNDVSELLSSESLEDKILGLILLDSSDDWEQCESYLTSYDKHFRSMDTMLSKGSFPVVISKQHVYVIISGTILRARKYVHDVFQRNIDKAWNIIYTDESIKSIEE